MIKLQGPSPIKNRLADRLNGDLDRKTEPVAFSQEGDALAVTLRVFVTACDWFPAASEALVAELTGILP